MTDDGEVYVTCSDVWMLLDVCKAKVWAVLLPTADRYMWVCVQYTAIDCYVLLALARELWPTAESAIALIENKSPPYNIHRRLAYARAANKTSTSRKQLLNYRPQPSKHMGHIAHAHTISDTTGSLPQALHVQLAIKRRLMPELREIQVLGFKISGLRFPRGQPIYWGCKQNYRD